MSGLGCGFNRSSRAHDVIEVDVASGIARTVKPTNTRPIRGLAAPLANSDDFAQLGAMPLSDLHHLHKGKIAGYGLRLPEYRAWWMKGARTMRRANCFG